MDLGVMEGTEVLAAFLGHVTKFQSHTPSTWKRSTVSSESRRTGNSFYRHLSTTMRKNLMRSVVDRLQKEQMRLEDQLRGVSAALTAFGKAYLAGRGPKRSATGKKRTISAAGRRRIAAAQRARWAKIRAGKGKKH